MEKSAQDLMEKVRRLAPIPRNPKRMDQATESINNWYGGISPDAKGALIRGLIGAGIAGGGTAIMRGLTPRDPDVSNAGHTLSPALLAALLGGTAAAGIPAGLKMLSGGIKFDKEKPKPALSRAIDKGIVEPVMGNLGTTVGGVTGLLKAPAASKFVQRFTGKGVRPGKAALVTVPAGLMLGAVIDRYLKGKM